MLRISTHFRSMKKVFRHLGGFTLLETLIVLSVLVIIALVLTPVFREGIDAWVLSISTTDIIAEGRLAMRRMTKELKRVDTITAISQTSVGFTVPGSSDTIVFSWDDSNNTLYREIPVIAQSNILARNISAFNFTYLGRDSSTEVDPTTGNPADVWEIRLDFTVTKDSHYLRFGSTVSPRNIIHQ